MNRRLILLHSNVKKITACSMLITCSFCLSYIEFLFPLNFIIPIPIIKIGLSNIITLFSLKKLGMKFALYILSIRILLQCFLFTSFSSFLFSIVGGLSALFMMSIALKYENKFFSIFGVSILGASFHNIGQISVAILYFKSITFIYYLPLLLIISLFTGFFIAFITQILLKHLSGISLK